MTDIQALLHAQHPLLLEDQSIYEDMLSETFRLPMYGGGGKYGPLLPTVAQKRLLTLLFEMIIAGVPIRIIILKARQLGISSLISAIMTVFMFMRNNLSCCVAAHEKQRISERIYKDYYKDLLDNLSPHLQPLAKRIKDGNGHRLLRTNSYIDCDYEAQIRGRAMHHLHLSEAAYFKDLPTFMGAVDNTLALAPNTSIFMESTANGYDDDFHRRWINAENGDDIFKPLFLSWFLHPNYVEPFESQEERDRFEDSISHNYHQRWGNEYLLYQHPDITLEHLKWRRNKLTSITLDDFYREFPSTPDEAFEYTDSNVFDPPVIRWYIKHDVLEHELEGEMAIDQPRFYEKSPLFLSTKPGIFRIFEPPHPDQDYFLGVDTSRGKQDYCCLQVIKRNPLEQVAIMRGFEGKNMIPLEFAEQLLMAWKYYNHGYLVIENNDAGLAVINNLLEWGCTNIMSHDTLFPNASTSNTDYGWNNNPKTKKEAIEKFKYYVMNKSIRIHDRETLLEMQNFIEKRTEPTGTSEGNVVMMARRKGQLRRPGDSDMGFYDDRIIALVSALLGHIVMPASPSARDRRIEQGQTDHDDFSGDPLSIDFHDEDISGMGYNPIEYMGVWDE